MRRLWVAVAVLIALFAATWGNTFYLSSLTAELTDLLISAEARGEAGDWETSLELTERAQALWEDRAVYLHTTLRHQDIDEVLLGLREVEEFLRCQEGGEYSAANARLIGHLELLLEQEQLNLKNLL